MNRPVIARVANLGHVSSTTDRSYQQFMKLMVLNVGSVTLLCALHIYGYIPTVTVWIGDEFSLVFGLLLIYGVSQATYQMWWFSRGINKLKSIDRGSEPVLQQLFGEVELHRRPPRIIEEVVLDSINTRLDDIRYPATLAAICGFFGTALGAALAIRVLAEAGIDTSEDVLRVLPEVAEGLSLAFGTTLVGLIVRAVIELYYRLVRGAAQRMKNRVLRTLYAHEEVSHGD